MQNFDMTEDKQGEMPPSPATAELREQVRQLEQTAGQLVRTKQYDEAEKLFREIARVARRHIPSRQFLGSRALARGELQNAQDRFEEIIRIAPRSAIGHQNLGIVLRARGYPEGALKAFDVALKLSPQLTMIWIQRGDVLQALGRREEALGAYLRAEQLSGNLFALASKTLETSPRTHQAVMRAASMLSRARRDVARQALAALHERQPGKDFDRCDAAIKHLCGTAGAKFEEPLQKPAFCYVPNLKARPFFDRDELTFLAPLEAQTDKIRAELSGILQERNDLAPYIQEPEGVNSPMTSLNRSRKWSSYHLYESGRRVGEHCERCPVTASAVEALPLVRMEGHAPEIFFSILEPGTHIPPHHGLANYKLAVHLPLIIPRQCAIRVGDETRGWKPGKCLIFDDSFEHEAWNRSDTLRAVLIFEVWNPELDETEREAISTAWAALNRLQRKLALLTENM